MNTLKRIALILVIIGAVHWGLIGFFQFDLVATVFAGQTAAFARVIYSLVGLSGLFCLTMLLDRMTETDSPLDNNRSAPSRDGNYGGEFGEDSNYDRKPPNQNTDLDK